MPRTLTQEETARFQTRLCDVAEKMFAERGVDGVSMRDLASAMGVSPMTPYRYFASREGILTAVRIRGFDRFSALLEAAYARTVGDAVAKAMAAGEAYIEFALANRNTYRLMFDAPQHDGNGDTPLDRAIERARRTLTVYGDGLRERGVGEAEARAMEMVVWSTLHGAVSLEMASALPKGSARQVLALWLRSVDAQFELATAGALPR